MHWSKLEDAFYERGNLSAELREQVRRTLLLVTTEYGQPKGIRSRILRIREPVWLLPSLIYF